MRKLKEHVYQKILKLNESQQQQQSAINENNSSIESNGTALLTASNSKTQTSNNNITDISERIIEIICSDQVRK